MAKFEIEARFMVFGRCYVEAESEREAERMANEGKFTNLEVEKHTAEIDSIDQIDRID